MHRKLKYIRLLLIRNQVIKTLLLSLFLSSVRSWAMWFYLFFFLLIFVLFIFLFCLVCVVTLNIHYNFITVYHLAQELNKLFIIIIESYPTEWALLLPYKIPMAFPTLNRHRAVRGDIITILFAFPCRIVNCWYKSYLDCVSAHFECGFDIKYISYKHIDWLTKHTAIDHDCWNCIQPIAD